MAVLVGLPAVRHTQGGTGIVVTRRQVLSGIGAAAVVTWRGPAMLRAQDAVKVGFVYVGPIGDMGWTYAHDQGRLELESNIPAVESTYVESVPETAADAERVIRQLAMEGNQVIFTTSFGYMDPTITIAENFPETVFIHISGYKTSE